MRVENEDEQHLIAANEQLSSLEDVVRIMPTAQYLNVAFNCISSLSGLEEMKKLRSLDVSHNTIESLQEVAMLSKLLVLKCSSNQITDLSWIAALKCLEELWIRDNRIESAQLAHLQQLTALQTLVIHPNPCTERDDYVLAILKVLPWLQRVDTAVVTEELREEARHAEERASLDSGATDCSFFSLSGRSEDPRSNEESSEDRVGTPPAPQMLSKKPAKSKQQMTAEEFMRAFPVQDFIPINSKGESAVIPENQLEDPENGVLQGKSWVSIGFHSETEDKQNEINTEQTMPDKRHSTVHGNEEQENRPLPKVETGSKPGGTSALLDSVLRLPTFDNDSFLKKMKSQPQLPANNKTKQRDKPKTTPIKSSGATLPFRQNEEYIVAYTSSRVTAIQVRCDGSAIARWSSGSVAISVDFETSAERSGYRVYAAHKDGQLALSFDPAGVGFLNAYPSGKTLLSTTSDGDGLLFNIGTGAISRQWDAQGRLRDGRCESAETLGDEPDGSLLCRLSEHLAVRVSLVDTQQMQSDNTKQSGRPNPISLQIYFAGAPGIRHVFVNSANRAVRCNKDACDYALGKASSKEEKVVRAKPHVEHSDLLNSIRAAVAGL